MSLFIFAMSLLFGAVVWAVSLAFRSSVSRSLTARDARLSDSLEEFSGSHGADAVLGDPTEGGVTRMYERMCVLEPSRWVGDPRIPDIIRRYRDIVQGREPDPEGRNVPSATLFGRPNPDYLLYLRSQRRKSVANPAVDNAVKWAYKEKRESEIRDGFWEALGKMGMPEELIPYAVTDSRLDSYSDRQWRDVVAACKRMCERYGEDLAKDMLKLFPEYEVLCSDEAAEKFDALCRQDVPYDVSSLVVRGSITMEQAGRAASLVEDYGYEWDKAVKEVLAEDSKAAKDGILRETYRQMVHRNSGRLKKGGAS